MKIGLISSSAPFIDGGYRFIAEWLNKTLLDYGYKSELVYIPFSEEDPETIFTQMTAFRLLNLEDRFDRVITFRPPSHVVRHREKIVWFIHHIRVFYDLWGTSYAPYGLTGGGINNPAGPEFIRKNLINADTAALGEAKKVFANSKIVAGRLKKYNNIDSEVLYPPVLNPERFFNGSYGDEIVCICRIEEHKRQHILAEAMKFVKSGVRLRICGAGSDENYIKRIKKIIEENGLKDKIYFENRWITEEEKAQYLSNALASVYIPFDEDSYGYPTIESALSGKCTVTVKDAGGVMEFVTDGECGLVVSNRPEDIAEAFDKLAFKKGLARELGENSLIRVKELNIGWENVVDKLIK